VKALVFSDTHHEFGRPIAPPRDSVDVVIHASVDIQHGSCRVLSNPAGYPTRRGRENPGFELAKVVEC
jgi:hypothetical protein